jgi:transposase
MAKRKFQLSESDRQQLIQAYALCKDGPTRTRYQAVRLYGEGYAVADIEQITGCSRTSLMEWCRAYQQDPMHGLVDKRAGGNCAKLMPLQIEALAQRLRQYTPRDLFGSAAHSVSGQYWTVDDLQVAVRQWYDVEYRSRTSYLHLLAVCEFSYQKTEKVYKSHSQLKVADFEEHLEKN